MKKIVSPVFLGTMLLVAGQLIQPAISRSAVVEIPDCDTPCRTQYKECFDKAKDSPNDIERDLCEKERKDCFNRCAEETARLRKEFELQQQQEMEERKQEMEERKRLEKEGLIPRRSAEERHEEDEETLDREEREKQERLEKAAREEQERQEKEREEKLRDETVNGIKIYQFEN